MLFASPHTLGTYVPHDHQCYPHIIKSYPTKLLSLMACMWYGMCPLCIVLVLVRHEKKWIITPKELLSARRFQMSRRTGFPYLFFINIIDLIN